MFKIFIQLSLLFLIMACLAGGWRPKSWPVATSTAPVPDATAAILGADFTPSSSSSPMVSISKYCVVVTGLKDGRVFLRSGPARKNRALGVVFEGERLNMLSTNQPPGTDWLHVRKGKITGWIYVKYCLEE